MITQSSAKIQTPRTPGGKNLDTWGVVLQLADTTWRIVVPVLIGAGAGLAVDRRLSQGPWLTLAGMAVGFVFAGLLVKKQVASVLSQESQEEKDK